MKLKRIVQAALAATAMALATSPASAVVHTLNLTGQVGNFTNFQQVAFGLNFDRYFLTLQGLDGNSPLSVAQGDGIDATITFDQLISMPQAQVRNDYLLYLFGTGFTGNPTGTSGTFEFYNGATLVRTLGFSAGTTSQIATFGLQSSPNNTAFAFDSIRNNFTIDTLDQPATLNQAQFNYNLVSNAMGVPEPATWAMMILGFGLVGSAMRRRARVTVRFSSQEITQ